MSSLVQELVDAGIHFGQRRSAWNPKMGPYIHSVKNQIHIINITETIKGLLLAKKFISKIVAEGKDVCFVGTKRQAKAPIAQFSQDCGMPCVTERWLGGTLTNFRTIRERLARLEELEQLVNSGQIETYSKKMTSQILREKKKIERNLAGIRNMNRIPGALIVVDVNKEINALREARSLGVPTICLIDTDGDPDMVDIPIPGNDDSMRSIEVIIRELAEAVTAGKTNRVAKAEGKDEAGGGAAHKQTRRRSSRSQYSAEARPAASGDSASEMSDAEVITSVAASGAETTSG